MAREELPLTVRHVDAKRLWIVLGRGSYARPHLITDPHGIPGRKGCPLTRWPMTLTSDAPTDDLTRWAATNEFAFGIDNRYMTRTERPAVVLAVRHPA